MNGYLSEWFPIKSGVAQGCPLSPLLFLVVAEALKSSLEMEPGLKGIKIGGIRHWLSQFADDTTIIMLMNSIKELPHANRALIRWCSATGMRENVPKREGLGMGRYKNRDLKHDVEWKKAREHCVSLGVPSPCHTLCSELILT